MMTRALLTAVLLLASACAHGPSEKEERSARIHFDLALERQKAGDAKEAYQQIEKAIALDPTFAPNFNVKGLMLHLSFTRYDEAIAAYQQALKLDPKYSEVHTNLGNVYLDQGRYDDAIAEYELALTDMLYVTPWFAHGNLGWAHYKAGRTDEALAAIARAIDLNADFCQGHRNQGIILEERGALPEALAAYRRFRESCPEVPEAYRREGDVQRLLGELDEARNSFAMCEAKSSDRAVKEDCRARAAQLD